jgi:hypothetical protein
VRRIIIETAPPGGEEPLVFSIDGQTPPRRRG